MSTEETLLFLTLAALNLGLAAAAARARPMLAALLAANGLYAAVSPLPLPRVPEALDGVTIALLLAVPAWWVRPRRPRLAAALLALAGVFALVRVAAVAGLVAVDTTLLRAFALRLAVLAGLVVFHLASRPVAPEAAEPRYFLAAYMLAGASLLPLPGNPVIWRPGPAPLDLAMSLLLVALWGAMAGGAVHALARAARREDRAAWVVVAMAAPVGVLVGFTGMYGISFLLLRPLLFGYGFLQEPLADRIHAPRPLLLLVLGAALVAGFLAPATLAAPAGALSAVTVGLVGLVFVVFLFARPLAATLLASHPPAPSGPDGGRYRVLRTLGEGAMGVAHLAEDRRLRRRVVLKKARTADPGAAARMLHEAQALARLDHPNIVRVLDATQEGRDVSLVLEHVEGAPPKGPLPEAQVARIAADLLFALAHAHARGVVHRDVKPANVLVEPSGRARLMDFGVARLAHDADATGFSWQPPEAGTPAYLSPEQVRGAPADARSDLYSLGVLLLELLTGRPPFEAAPRNGYDVRLAILQDAPALPDDPRWRAFLGALLAKDPEARPPDAEAARRLLPA